MPPLLVGFGFSQIRLSHDSNRVAAKQESQGWIIHLCQFEYDLGRFGGVSGLLAIVFDLKARRLADR
jgi:hypothetical protein